MEEKLYEAAIMGSTKLLHDVIEQDKLILDRIALGSSMSTPLHVASSMGHLDLVKYLLTLRPDLAAVLDPRRRSTLHLASAKGHLAVVKALFEGVGEQNFKEMCTGVDVDGRNPIHVAAMKGKIEVLKELMARASPQAARARVDQGRTILHLCVLYKQTEALKVLIDGYCHELVNVKDDGGNTILHLAVADKQLQVVQYLTETHQEDISFFSSSNGKVKVDINSKNLNDFTALDIIQHSGTQAGREAVDIQNILVKNKAKRGRDLPKTEWLTEKRESLMIVAILIAAMAFQAGVTPPGNVWQDDKNGHRAGEAVMAYNYPDSFPYFLRANTVGFVASLSTILLLMSDLPFRKKIFMWFLVLVMWLTITSMAFTYAFSITVITPKKDRRSLSRTIVVAVIVWCSVMSILLLVHTLRLMKKLAEEKWDQMAAIRLLNPKKLLSRTYRSSAKGCQNNV